MYCKKRSGPRTEPCGIPDFTGTSSDASPSRTTAWVQPTKNDLIHQKVLPRTPCWESLSNSLRWLTLSKALLKSKRTRSTCLHWLSCLDRSSTWTSCINWVSHERFYRKPCCSSYNIWRMLKCLVRFYAMICSITWQSIQEGLDGVYWLLINGLIFCWLLIFGLKFYWLLIFLL